MKKQPVREPERVGEAESVVMDDGESHVLSRAETSIQERKSSGGRRSAESAINIKCLLVRFLIPHLLLNS
jgi:hypothetical protein